MRELAARGRWDEAERYAGELSEAFRDVHAVARHSFDGLRLAARTRDHEELQDFAELILELFDPRPAPPPA